MQFWQGILGNRQCLDSTVYIYWLTDVMMLFIFIRTFRTLLLIPLEQTLILNLKENFCSTFKAKWIISRDFMQLNIRKGSLIDPLFRFWSKLKFWLFFVIFTHLFTSINGLQHKSAYDCVRLHLMNTFIACIAQFKLWIS